MRPGFKTSEFWLTVLGQGVALCVVMGLVKPAGQSALETALCNAVTAVFTLLASTATVWSYIRSRTDLKLRQLDQPETTPPRIWQPPAASMVLMALLLLPGLSNVPRRHTAWRSIMPAPAAQLSRLPRASANGMTILFSPGPRSPKARG